ncbi:hypothetical protein HYT25_03330 [Candidatus Pacearchaeota archaeon]|nr:hypothetical protein [Candidatus Pacearchaeota archaeon]
MDEKINAKLEELLGSTDAKRIITICSIDKKIKINGTDEYWFGRDENQEIYDTIIKKYHGRISDSYCSKHFKAVLSEHGFEV